MSESNDELVNSIGPYVLQKLTTVGFFEKLDDKLCPPENEAAQPNHCRGKYEISEPLLRALGFDDEERNEIFQVLQSKGGFCDCEILYNVVETNRLKATYWKARAAGLEPTCHESH
jgi:Protein of unknown function (DUF2695)